MATESILLEAARTFDELPSAEQKIPSKDLVFRRTAESHDLHLEGGSSDDDGLTVSRREAETWKWIDGRRTVGEIRERAFLSDLDVLKGISDLLDRGMIEEGQQRETPEVTAAPASDRRGVSFVPAAFWIPVIAVLAIALSFMPRNAANLFFRPIWENRPASDQLKAISLARLIAVGRAVRVYYGTTGRYPRTIGQLAADGIVDEDSLRDPYGRFFRYILRSEDGKFALYGRNAKGEIDLDLSHEGQLAPEAESGAQSAPPPGPQDRPPAVRVVR
jgi:hypothetical protein